MWYQYFAAYKIEGISQPSDAQERVIYAEIDAEARVVYDVDTHLFDVDRKAAIGSLLLSAVFGQSVEGSVEARIVPEMESLRRARAETIGPGLFLIFEATGEIGPFELTTQRELPDFVIAIGGPSKLSIRSRYAATLNGLLTSFVLASETVHGLTRVADEIVFRTDDGKPIYAYSLGGSAKASVSTTLKPELLDFVSQTAKVLADSKGLADPARLVVRSFRDDGDDLLAFLSAWAGLEIFVSQNFSEYEAAAFERLSGPDKFIGRIRTVMNDKYRLADKFSLIAFELTPPAAPAKDEAIFKELKDIRDKLMHGGEVGSLSVPAEKARKLLRRYLKLRVERLSG